MPVAPDTVPAAVKSSPSQSDDGEAEANVEALRQAQDLLTSKKLELTQLAETVKSLTDEREQQAAELANSQTFIEKLQTDLGTAEEKTSSFEALQQELEQVREKAKKEALQEAELAEHQKKSEELEGQLKQQADELSALQQRLEAQPG